MLAQHASLVHVAVDVNVNAEVARTVQHASPGLCRLAAATTVGAMPGTACVVQGVASVLNEFPEIGLSVTLRRRPVAAGVRFSIATERTTRRMLPPGTSILFGAITPCALFHVRRAWVGHRARYELQPSRDELASGEIAIAVTQHIIMQ